MKKTLFGLLGAIMVVISGCKSDVDLKNISSRIEAEMGIAIPVGDMKVTTNDFLGGNQIKKIYTDEYGIFHFIDTLDIPVRDYHMIDLSDYVSETTDDFKVYDQLQQNGYLDAQGNVKQNKKGSPIYLQFPLHLVINKLNNNPQYERLDSVQVTNAEFTSTVNITKLNLQWEWVNSIDVVLGSQFRKQGGNTVNIYTKGGGKGYGQPIPVAIDAFTACFMKDPSDAPAADNVINYCDFTFLFSFTIPTTASVTIDKNSSAFNYNFQSKFIGFDAAWGFFQASNKMRDRDYIILAEEWEDWNDVKKIKMRFMEPEVKVTLSHHVAAPLYMYLDTLIASNTDREKVSATWDGETHTSFPLDKCLSPLSPLSDSVINTKLFNYELSKGHLDQLFEIRPDTLFYSYTLLVDKNDRYDYPWKQHRVTSNTQVKGYAAVDLPFKVNSESEAQYLTKIEDVDFSRVNLDSLLEDVDIIEESNARNIKLWLTFTNGLPFDINGKVKFLDKDSNQLDLHFTGDDDWNIVHIPAPKMERHSGEKYGYITEPGLSTVILNVVQSDFDLLTQCKHLRLDAYMGANPQPCVIDTTNYMRVHVGVAANVQAIMDFNKKEDDKK